MPMSARMRARSRSLPMLPDTLAAVAEADLDAVHLDRALVVRFQQIDAAEQGRLAAARRADDHDHFALVHVEVDAVQDAVGAKRLLDVADANDGTETGSVTGSLPDVGEARL